MKKHKIATQRPPAAAPQARTVVELAGVRRRLASFLYESLLLLGILAVAFMVPYLLLGLFGNHVVPGWLMWGHIFLVFGFYFVWYWCHHGQTLAMQTWRLRLVRADDGMAVSVGLGWWRYVLAWPSVLLGGVGLWWAIFDPERQFLHDRLAGTRVVLLPKTVPADASAAP